MARHNIWFLTVFLCWSPAAPAAPVVSENITHYVVAGTSVPHLGNALNRATPLYQNGKAFHAYTDTRFSWNARWHQTPNECAITGVETSVKIDYLLPKLSSAVKNKQVLAVWIQYFSALTRHEKGHAQLAIEAALKIESRLTGLKGRGSCRQLAKIANKLVYEVLDEFEERNIEYDRLTDHGKTEGARLGLHF